MSSPFISCPEFLKLERSIIEEFFACTRESNIEAASCIQALNQQANADDINRLFRALHSLKGNCQMVGLTPFTEPLHRIEDIVAKIRSGDLPYAPIVGDFLILATDEIEDLLEELISTSQANNIRRERLCLISQNLLNQLRPENIQQEFERALSELDGRIKTTKQEQKSKKVLLEVPADLEFMRTFAAHIDNLSIYRKDRSDQLVQLMEQFNEALAYPVKMDQLQAASWMHDIGMSFIPHSIFNKGVTF